jgi:hypothetical protein
VNASTRRHSQFNTWLQMVLSAHNIGGPTGYGTLQYGNESPCDSLPVQPRSKHRAITRLGCGRFRSSLLLGALFLLSGPLAFSLFDCRHRPTTKLYPSLSPQLDFSPSDDPTTTSNYTLFHDFINCFLIIHNYILIISKLFNPKKQEIKLLIVYFYSFYATLYLSSTSNILC